MPDMDDILPPKGKHYQRSYIAQEDRPVIIEALRTGGWSVAMLADKFETTEQSILTLWNRYCYKVALAEQQAKEEIPHG